MAFEGGWLLMKDIVTRLKNYGCEYDGLCNICEAGIEIERLREQVRQLEAEREQWQRMAVRNDS